MSNQPQLPLHLRRNEIAAFVGDDPRAIRTIEKLLAYLNTIVAPQIQGLQISEFSDFNRTGDEERNLGTSAHINNAVVESKIQQIFDTVANVSINSAVAESKAQQALDSIFNINISSDVTESKASQALDIATKNAIRAKNNTVMQWLSM